MTSSPVQRRLQPLPDLTINFSEAGSGPPVLVLHGGGGPATVAGLAAHLATRQRVLVPTHPGWDGSDRPDWCTGIDDLALAYLHLLGDLDLRDVPVVGSSIGGWLAAELAVWDSSGRIGGLVLIDAVGIEVAGEPIRDFFALDARGVADYSYHDPARFFVDPAAVPAEQLARRAANMTALRTYAGDPYMHDPKLRRRLGAVEVPTLLLWGESDRIVTPAYGRAYAEAFGAARLVLIPEAGHLPQIEQPEATWHLIDDFIARRG